MENTSIRPQGANPVIGSRPWISSLATGELFVLAVSLCVAGCTFSRPADWVERHRRSGWTVMWSESATNGLRGALAVRVEDGTVRTKLYLTSVSTQTISVPKHGYDSIFSASVELMGTNGVVRPAGIEYGEPAPILRSWLKRIPPGGRAEFACIGFSLQEVNSHDGKRKETVFIAGEQYGGVWFKVGEITYGIRVAVFVHADRYEPGLRVKVEAQNDLELAEQDAGSEFRLWTGTLLFPRFWIQIEAGASAAKINSIREL